MLFQSGLAYFLSRCLVESLWAPSFLIFPPTPTAIVAYPCLCLYTQQHCQRGRDRRCQSKSERRAQNCAAFASTTWGFWVFLAVSCTTSAHGQSRTFWRLVQHSYLSHPATRIPLPELLECPQTIYALLFESKLCKIPVSIKVLDELFSEKSSPPQLPYWTEPQ